MMMMVMFIVCVFGGGKSVDKFLSCLCKACYAESPRKDIVGREENLLN